MVLLYSFQSSDCNIRLNALNNPGGYSLRTLYPYFEFVQQVLVQMPAGIPKGPEVEPLISMFEKIWRSYQNLFCSLIPSREDWVRRCMHLHKSYDPVSLSPCHSLFQQVD